jgi:hypothetical protein
MSWLDETKTVKNDIGKGKRTSGTRMVKLDLPDGYKATAIPQWLHLDTIHVQRYMPALELPTGNSIMLTRDICNDVESALRTAIRYRYYMLKEELEAFEQLFFD